MLNGKYLPAGKRRLFRFGCCFEKYCFPQKYLKKYPCCEHGKVRSCGSLLTIPERSRNRDFRIWNRCFPKLWKKKCCCADFRKQCDIPASPGRNKIQKIRSEKDDGNSKRNKRLPQGRMAAPHSQGYLSGRAYRNNLNIRR